MLLSHISASRLQLIGDEAVPTLPGAIDMN
jgi:hypothetical protein